MSRSGKSGNSLATKLEKKRRDLKAAQEAHTKRKAEEVVGVAGAMLGLVFGKKKGLGGVGSALTKDRMEDAAEARVEGLTAEVRILEEQLGAATRVDPATLVEERITPGPKELSILRVAVIYLS